MMNSPLTQLLSRLNEPLHRYAELDRYYDGKQPLAFLSPEAKVAVQGLFGVTQHALQHDAAILTGGEGDKGTMKFEEFAKKMNEEVQNMINKW